LLIVNSNELDPKTKEKEKRKRKKETTCCHRLLHNTITIEEGNNIVAITFFVTKPLKKVTIVIVAIFCNKTIEKGDGSCCLLLFLCDTTTEKGDTNLESSPSSLQ
jgi:hypothetical protein